MDSIYLVRADTCAGCVYYGRLSPDTRCCNYAVDTGLLRPRGEPPCQCSVKKLGNRRRHTHEIIMRQAFDRCENWQANGGTLSLDRREKSAYIVE